ncbi:MAG: uracil-DNA glycosylase [bacterium]|nr:uracil-DNA glycosylase [bacterium]
MVTKSRKLKKISQEIAKCSACRRGKIGKAVPGEGNSNARIVFIGEAPGREEAKTGRPFVGRAGKLLRSLIKGSGLSEKEVFIANPVKRLPKYGTPKRQDILHGKMHLQKQLAVMNPKIIVLLGRVAMQAFFNKPPMVTKFHGRVLEKNGRRYFITFHPSAGLRFKKFKVALEKDFNKLKAVLRTMK